MFFDLALFSRQYTLVCGNENRYKRGTQFSVSGQFQMLLDVELLSGIYTKCADTTSSKIPHCWDKHSAVLADLASRLWATQCSLPSPRAQDHKALHCWDTALHCTLHLYQCPQITFVSNKCTHEELLYAFNMWDGGPTNCMVANH